ncbi:uncharacterized protein F5891DRAFT_1185874 [Suillus fuscotomentosus]|uniref:Uncharacterized protein n=1 Tax=Suillus fuscotomentosus TaxID=1912939 RepID=A0AAD4HML5_9AGAM|nr:uncharacterized protein F5891DRAFT_1185874 [Suillus fuscotomentosus]KAG1903225.1 hypothetical protein F5891DRAFT_1185874 [Suillus fuscotomentosus]
MLTVSVNVHTQADTAQCSVLTMLMKVDMLDAMALTSAGHLVEEHTVTDSRWTDNVRNVASSSLDYIRHDTVPRAFTRDPTNPPHPPSS